jgi:hypothetical protein
LYYKKNEEDNMKRHQKKVALKDVVDVMNEEEMYAVDVNVVILLVNVNQFFHSYYN